MKSFDQTWEEIHASREWGKYPSEPVIRFIARNYYKCDRNHTKILDFGCGAGSHTWYLAREGFDTYAFDGSKSAVERVQKKMKEENLHADLRIRDALELDYEEDFFDCIIDGAVVYANEVKYIVKMFESIYRMLKYEGKLFSVSFATDTTGYGTGKEIEKNTFIEITKGNLAGRGVTHFFTKEELLGILQNVGFRDIIIDTMKFTDQGSEVSQFLVQAKK